MQLCVRTYLLEEQYHSCNMFAIVRLLNVISFLLLDELIQHLLLILSKI